MFNEKDKQVIAQIIMSDLNTDDVFPIGALLHAKHVRDELEPLLRADLEGAIGAVQNDEEPSQSSFYALHLLNEFRSPALYPLLLNK